MWTSQETKSQTEETDPEDEQGNQNNEINMNTNDWGYKGWYGEDLARTGENQGA